MMLALVWFRRICCVFGRGVSDGVAKLKFAEFAAKHEVQRRGRARDLVLHACCSCDDPGLFAVLFEILFIWGHSRESALRLECTRAREDKRRLACRSARPADDDPLCAGNIARTRMIVTTSARRTASLSPDRACRAIVQ